MIGVSITYTTGIKGATSSDIFRLRMGPQFARRRPENIRAGLLIRWFLISTQGHNKYQHPALDSQGRATKAHAVFGVNVSFKTILYPAHM
jgi:hypothetical protein